MPAYLKVSDDIARQLFNELISWDIYGYVVIDEAPALRAYVDYMSDIIDYEQPLQPSLVAALRAELSTPALSDLDSADAFLQITSDYPKDDLLFTAAEYQDVRVNMDAIGDFRARQLATETR